MLLALFAMNAVGETRLPLDAQTAPAIPSAMAMRLRSANSRLSGTRRIRGPNRLPLSSSNILGNGGQLDLRSASSISRAAHGWLEACLIIVGSSMALPVAGGESGRIERTRGGLSPFRGARRTCSITLVADWARLDDAFYGGGQSGQLDDRLAQAVT